MCIYVCIDIYTCVCVCVCMYVCVCGFQSGSSRLFATFGGTFVWREFDGDVWIEFSNLIRWERDTERERERHTHREHRERERERETERERDSDKKTRTHMDTHSICYVSTTKTLYINSSHTSLCNLRNSKYFLQIFHPAPESVLTLSQNTCVSKWKREHRCVIRVIIVCYCLLWYTQVYE